MNQPKRHHERLTRSEFESWLLKLPAVRAVEWIDPPKPHPDWIVKVNGVEWGVEATTIVPSVVHGKNQILEPTVTASITEFVDEIEERALADGILAGAYGLSIGPMPGNQALREEILTKALGYLERTKHMSNAPPQLLAEVGYYMCEIQKLHRRSNYIAEVIDLGTRLDSEIEQDFEEKVTEMIERKASTYSDIDRSTILLLLDGFHIVDPVKWLDTVSRIESSSVFHAIFRIKPANDPLLLSCTSDYWSGLNNQ